MSSPFIYVEATIVSKYAHVLRVTITSESDVDKLCEKMKQALQTHTTTIPPLQGTPNV